MKNDKKKRQNNGPSRQSRPPGPSGPTERMKFWGSVALIIIILGYAANYSIDSMEVANNSPETNTQTGAQLFAQHCASCHGQKGVGQDTQRPKGGLLDNDSFLAPALNGTGHGWHHKTEDLFNTIKYGSMEPTSSMKGFKEQLTDEDISKIIVYFQSLWPTEIKQMYDQRNDT